MKKSRCQEGFTLIEVVIAIAVLTIAILAFNVMHLSAINGNSSANKISGAVNAGADRIERIFAMDYEDLRDDENADGSPGVGDGLAGLDPAANDTAATADARDSSAPPGYEIYWNVAEDYPMPLTKTVSVIVKRADKGQVKTVVYNYIKAEVVAK